MVKTNGAELKRFWGDPEVCGKGEVIEGDSYLIDGEEVDSFGLDVANIRDEAKISIVFGYVRDEAGKDESLFSVFRKWRKAQNTATFVVTCDVMNAEELRAIIKANGGKVQ